MQKNFWWSKLKHFPKYSALHLNKCRKTSFNLWRLLLSPFLSNYTEKSRAGRGWVTLDGIAPHSTCWSTGFEGTSCPTPLCTQPWQCVTGFGLCWAVRNSKWPSPGLNPEEKMQEHTCSNHHLALSVWTGQTPSSLLSAERAISLGSKTSCNEQGTETLISPQPAGLLECCLCKQTSEMNSEQNWHSSCPKPNIIPGSRSKMSLSGSKHC